jgi:hypothetical protein
MTTKGQTMTTAGTTIGQVMDAMVEYNRRTEPGGVGRTWQLFVDDCWAVFGEAPFRLDRDMETGPHFADYWLSIASGGLPSDRRSGICETNARRNDA